MERQFLPSAAKLTNGFPCRKSHETNSSTYSRGGNSQRTITGWSWGVFSQQNRKG